MADESAHRAYRSRSCSGDETLVDSDRRGPGRICAQARNRRIRAAPAGFDRVANLWRDLPGDGENAAAARIRRLCRDGAAAVRETIGRPNRQGEDSPLLPILRDAVCWPLVTFVSFDRWSRWCCGPPAAVP